MEDNTRADDARIAELMQTIEKTAQAMVKRLEARNDLLERLMTKAALDEWRKTHQEETK